MQKITARREFSFLWLSKSKRKVIVAARGCGKTYAVCQYILEKLLKSEKSNFRVAFFSATLEQAKKTVEPIMRELLADFPKIYKFNTNEGIYRFYLGEGDVRELLLLSYEKEDRNRGIHPQMIVLDECASMPASMFGNIILPMLTGSDGEMIAIGTPQGHNKFHELFQLGANPDYPEWESYMIKASDCEVFSSEYLWQQRNNLTSAEYAQEYECDFNANVLLGSVYGEFIDRFVLAHKNIHDTYTWDPNKQVYISWDLGWSDATALWFFQKHNGIINFIDYYENSGKDMTFYADYIGKKPYSYKTMILPHDGAHGNVRGASVVETLNSFGYRCEVLPRRSEQEGIEEARKLLMTCRFDRSTCSEALQKLKTFKFKIDRKTGLKTNETVHDESSHCADAFRYAAMSRDIWIQPNFSNKIVIRADYSVLN